jgi:hypothetical protein
MGVWILGNLGKDVGKTGKHGVSRCYSWEMCQRNREKTLGGYHQIALYYTDLYGLQIVMYCEGVTTAVGGEYVLVLARLLHRCQTFVISRKWLSCWFQWGYGVGLLALHRGLEPVWLWSLNDSTVAIFINNIIQPYLCMLHTRWCPLSCWFRI